MEIIEKTMGDIAVHRRPRVLVMLATYNAGDWLKPQIDSILAQEGVDVRIVIGDDVSRDETRHDIHKHWGDFPNIELFEWETPSGSAGANFRRLYRSANVLDFEFFALADQDDVWLPRKLIDAIEAIGRTGARGYSCAVEAFWPSGTRKIISQHGRVRQSDYLFEGAGQGCTFVLAIDLFSRVRDFCVTHHDASESLHYHDWLIYLLARTWGMNWVFDQHPSMLYRQHENNEIGSRGSFGSIFKRLKMIQNGWYRGQINAALEIVTLAGGNSDIESFSRMFRQANSPLRRFKLARYMIFHGRRRFADRVVQAFAGLAGWI